MFVVAGDTWRMWDRIRDFQCHLLWQFKHHSNIHWYGSKIMNQAHWYPYALYKGACAWWYHCSALLRIFKTSSRYLHQIFLWEYIKQSQITAGDYWSCCEAWVKKIFPNFVLQPMFKGGFSHVVFASFLGCMNMQYVKGWLSLVARTYIILIYYS